MWIQIFQQLQITYLVKVWHISTSNPLHNKPTKHFNHTHGGYEKFLEKIRTFGSEPLVPPNPPPSIKDKCPYSGTWFFFWRLPLGKHLYISKAILRFKGQWFLIISVNQFFPNFFGVKKGDQAHTKLNWDVWFKDFWTKIAYSMKIGRVFNNPPTQHLFHPPCQIGLIRKQTIFIFSRHFFKIPHIWKKGNW